MNFKLNLVFTILLLTNFCFGAIKVKGKIVCESKSGFVKEISGVIADKIVKGEEGTFPTNVHFGLSGLVLRGYNLSDNTKISFNVGSQTVTTSAVLFNLVDNSLNYVYIDATLNTIKLSQTPVSDNAIPLLICEVLNGKVIKIDKIDKNFIASLINLNNTGAEQ